jgi:hypothetical protein
MGCCDGCFDSSACGRRRILSTLVIFNGTWQRSTRRPKSIGSIDAVSMRFGEARGGAHERQVVVGCRRRRRDVERAWGLAPRRKNGFLNQHAVCDKKAERALPGGAHDHLSGAPHGPCQMCGYYNTAIELYPTVQGSAAGRAKIHVMLERCLPPDDARSGGERKKSVTVRRGPKVVDLHVCESGNV